MIPIFGELLMNKSILIIGSILTIFVFNRIIQTLLRRAKCMQECEKIPGPRAEIPFFGSITVLLVRPDAMFKYMVEMDNKWRKDGHMFRIWIGPFPLVFLGTAESSEGILSSNKILDKSREYTFLNPWLGTGLLTSTGSKWQKRRKMLTPAFHFGILEQFLQVFNEQSRVLMNLLNEITESEIFNVYPYITNCTLDIICETAMGQNVGAQMNSSSEYVKAVNKISEIIQVRQSTPWLQPSFLFRWFPQGKEHQKCLSILHNFTEKVIRERKAKYLKKSMKNVEFALNKESAADDAFLKKPRLAFLDLLIEYSQNGTVLSDLDIREEVDTFMFEGHDTTAAAICWSLFLIGRHPAVQKLVHEELEHIFGQSDRPVTMNDLNELKYLECCIKEALRLYPSVPILARELIEDTKICGYNIPAGASVVVTTYLLHRDSRYFPEPELYQPERFFPENCRNRPAFAYVPFSAGPRNCIGQKFASIEEKVILSSILRQFKIESMDKPEELTILSAMILKPRDGITLRLTKKSST